MTDEQYQQFIAYMYSENAQTGAVGLALGQAVTWLHILCLLLVVAIFLLAFRR